MSESSGVKRYVIGGSAAACAACCAAPILALVGIAGAGTVATLATVAFAGLAFGLAVALASLAAFVARKRHRDREVALATRGGRLLPDPVRRDGLAGLDGS